MNRFRIRKEYVFGKISKKGKLVSAGKKREVSTIIVSSIKDAITAIVKNYDQALEVGVIPLVKSAEMNIIHLKED